MSAAKTSVLLFASTPRPAKSSGLRPAVIMASACADKIQTLSTKRERVSEELGAVKNSLDRNKDKLQREQVRKRGLPPPLLGFDQRGQAPLPDLFILLTDLSIILLTCSFFLLSCPFLTCSI